MEGQELGAEILSVASVFLPLSMQKEGTLGDSKWESEGRPGCLGCFRFPTCL